VSPSTPHRTTEKCPVMEDGKDVATGSCCHGPILAPTLAILKISRFMLHTFPAAAFCEGKPEREAQRFSA
jgi:hypothetical protein